MKDLKSYEDQGPCCQATCMSMEEPELQSKECSNEDVTEEDVAKIDDSLVSPQQHFPKEVQVNIAKCLKCEKYSKQNKNLTRKLRRLTVKVTRLKMVSIV